jgi:hypothetical protein
MFPSKFSKKNKLYANFCAICTKKKDVSYQKWWYGLVACAGVGTVVGAGSTPSSPTPSPPHMMEEDPHHPWLRPPETKEDQKSVSERSSLFFACYRDSGMSCFFSPFYCIKLRVGRMLSFFSSRRNWDSPNPSPTGECAPPRYGGRGTLAGERGVGGVLIPTRGHTLRYSLYIRTLWHLGYPTIGFQNWGDIGGIHRSIG